MNCVDPINYFCIHDDRIESEDVWNEQTNFLASIENVERMLLSEGNFSYDQPILVRLLNYRMTKCVQNFDCAANDLKNFVSEQQLLSIRVHSCPFVVNALTEGQLANGGSACYCRRDVFRVLERKLPQFHRHFLYRKSFQQMRCEPIG